MPQESKSPDTHRVLVSVMRFQPCYAALCAVSEIGLPEKMRKDAKDAPDVVLRKISASKCLVDEFAFIREAVVSDLPSYRQRLVP